MSVEERTARLEAAIRVRARQGWRIQSQSTTQASLLKEKPISHVLHLFLTIFTLGIWATAWRPMGMFGGEQSEVLMVDVRGKVWTSLER